MEYLFSFDKMVSPVIIRVVYFLLLIGVVVSAIGFILSGAFLRGIGVLIFGALGVRIWCELLILAFRIHDNLVEINKSLKNRN